VLGGLPAQGMRRWPTSAGGSSRRAAAVCLTTSSTSTYAQAWLTHLRVARSKVDYDNVLADSEREAVADLLNYLENVLHTTQLEHSRDILDTSKKKRELRRRADTGGVLQRAETDFFSGEPLAALSTLVYSQNIDLQRSASLTFAEITERGMGTAEVRMKMVGWC
jgi:hypothetical protein